MLKVLIADDEIRVCRLIQMLVDWESLHMEVVGTAANGFEALEQVEGLRPDILITDIRMPGCDGLELIEKAKQLQAQMEIIIVSGYAQFEYAQIAIQRGVGGYLLKPIKKEALLAALEKLGGRIWERRNSETEIKHLRLDEQKRQALLRERLLEDLIHQRHNLRENGALAREYGFSAAPGLFQAFIIKVDDPRNMLREPNLAVIAQKAADILAAEAFPRCHQGVMRFYGPCGYGILHYGLGLKEELRRRLRACLNQLQAQQSFFGSIELTMALGQAGDESQLPDSMQEAKCAVAERLVEGTGRLLEGRPAPSRLNARLLLEKYNRAMGQAVESLNIETADLAVTELAAAARATANVRGYELLELVANAARMLIVRLEPEREADLLGAFAGQCEWCSKEGQLFEALRQFLEQQLKAAWEQQRNESIRPIRMAKQYVGQHYMEPITLEDVCAAIGFSVSYFSTLFKKETGEGFAKYLARVRMEQAKALLQDTDYPVAEICERVGYNDLKHFTNNFKKATGLNPGQYRKLYG